MPIHDWTRVDDGTFHAFHVGWISAIQEALNEGGLPPTYYAQAEQIIGPMGPDVLALQRTSLLTDENGAHEDLDSGTGVALAVATPRARLVAETTMDDYASRRRTIVVRHKSGNRIVALIEIVSPGNKGSVHAWRTFLEKATDALALGYHLLIVDLFPPTSRDPEGVHGAIWERISRDSYALPTGTPLTLAAYAVGTTIRAYVEQTAIGRELLEMPLFLEPELYVNVPLEATYQAAYRGVPRHLKQVLEAPAEP